MWTKKNTDQDVLFESGTAWFAAPYNVSSITKPKKIKDWEGDSTFYDVMSKAFRWNRPRAMLTGARPFSGPSLPFCLPVIATRSIVLSIGAESSG